MADHFTLATAQLHGGQRTTSRRMDQRADGIRGDVLAPERSTETRSPTTSTTPAYLESMFGLYKVSLVPVNTNYRYGDDELVYLWTNCDAVAVIFHASLTERVQRARPESRVWTWLCVAGASGWVPRVGGRLRASHDLGPWTDRRLLGSQRRRPLSALHRRHDGHAQGVMWRPRTTSSPSSTPRRTTPSRPSRPRRHSPNGSLVGTTQSSAPLMHGTGAFNAMWNLTLAGSVVTLESRTFDVIELLDTCEQERVKSMSIVGGRRSWPILQALEAEPDRWDISSLRVIVSSGVMWARRRELACSATTPAHHGRLAGLVRGHQHGQCDHHRGGPHRRPDSASDRTHAC